MISKPAYWTIVYFLLLYYDDSSGPENMDPRLKVFTALMYAISNLSFGISFMIIHVTSFRVVIAYYVLKIKEEAEKEMRIRKYTTMLYVHCSIYLAIIILLFFIQFFNVWRL